MGFGAFWDATEPFIKAIAVVFTVLSGVVSAAWAWISVRGTAKEALRRGSKAHDRLDKLEENWHVSQLELMETLTCLKNAAQTHTSEIERLRTASHSIREELAGRLGKIELVQEDTRASIVSAQLALVKLEATLAAGAHNVRA